MGKRDPGPKCRAFSSRQDTQHFFHLPPFLPALHDFGWSCAFYAGIQRTALTGDVHRPDWNGRVIPESDALFGVLIEQDAKGDTHVPVRSRVARLGNGNAKVFFASANKYSPLDAYKLQVRVFSLLVLKFPQQGYGQPAAALMFA